MVIKNLFKQAASPFLAIALVCFILAGISFTAAKTTTTKSYSQKVKPTTVPSKTPTPTQAKQFTKQYETKVTPTPTTSSVTQIATQQTENTPTPQPTQSTKDSPTTPPNDAITLQINAPDGGTNFSLNFRDNSNPCTVLTDAKNEGKLRSLTITRYGPPLNSDYVKEINGFSDNWTFAINGDGKPMGCSHYILGKGNTVTWKYN